ncbi:hypothetical protein [Halodesulfurarchaeum sp.]|uniref:hypothetical protein n=1 Tax=Halodesulfurarchaeum sp. TaxID=1980530 RepID=UPI002FC3BCE8
MPTDERVDVGLGAWRPPDQYNKPQLEPKERAGTVETETREDSTKHHPSEEAEVFTLQGDAYADDISDLQKYKGHILSLRHDVYSGKVYVESVRASSTDRWDDVTDFRIYEGEMQEVTEQKPVYSYSVDLRKADVMETE